MTPDRRADLQRHARYIEENGSLIRKDLATSLAGAAVVAGELFGPMFRNGVPVAFTLETAVLLTTMGISLGAAFRGAVYMGHHGWLFQRYDAIKGSQTTVGDFFRSMLLPSRFRRHS